MAQSPFFIVPIPIKTAKNSFFALRNFKFAASSNSSSSPNFQDNHPEPQPTKLEPVDSVKLAFSKAIAYKESINAKPTIPNIVQDSLVEGSGEIDSSNADAGNDDIVKKEAPLAVKLALEKAREYKKNKGVLGSEGSSLESVKEKPVVESDGVDQKDDGNKDVPLAVKLALEKAKEYKKNKGVLRSDAEEMRGSEALDSGLKEGNRQSQSNNGLTKDSGKKGELSISSIDFIGLGFADKKSGRGLPAGLVPISDPFPEGELPEVEIIVGDKSKFDNSATESKPKPITEDDVDVYEPKVSTWGVFPRPRDISKAYGGGRTIRPGEALEPEEKRAAKDARTRRLLAAYKRKTGQDIDPKLKAICEKALEDGDSLMDVGKLREALTFYAKVMEKLPFQSKLHGLAALQWSICQDSLSRSDEARIMYEKLKSHPNPNVSKKARQLVFSFQAMEMMKVSSSDVSPLSSGYQNYFEAFVKDKKNIPSQKAEVDEGLLSSQTLPYVIFLLSPLLIISLIAAFKHR